MLNFDFLEKGLRIVTPPHFVCDFSRKMCLMLYSFNWPNFIVWMPLLLEILVNMCTAIVCLPGCGVIKFEINLIFLIEPFFYMTKMSRLKIKYLESEKSFQGEIKSIFHYFQRTLSFQKLSQTLEYVYKLEVYYKNLFLKIFVRIFFVSEFCPESFFNEAPACNLIKQEILPQVHSACEFKQTF